MGVGACCGTLSRKFWLSWLLGKGSGQRRLRKRLANELAVGMRPGRSRGFSGWGWSGCKMDAGISQMPDGRLLGRRRENK